MGRLGKHSLEDAALEGLVGGIVGNGGGDGLVGFKHLLQATTAWIPCGLTPKKKCIVGIKLGLQIMSVSLEGGAGHGKLQGGRGGDVVEQLLLGRLT